MVMMVRRNCNIQTTLLILKQLRIITGAWSILFFCSNRFWAICQSQEQPEIFLKGQIFQRPSRSRYPWAQCWLLRPLSGSLPQSWGAQCRGDPTLCEMLELGTILPHVLWQDDSDGQIYRLDLLYLGVQATGQTQPQSAWSDSKPLSDATATVVGHQVTKHSSFSFRSGSTRWSTVLFFQRKGVRLLEESV